MKNVAVILAGGVGSRLGLSIPKQFYKVAGKSVIEHTISTFEDNENIDEIYIVIHSQYKQMMESICLRNNWTKVAKILNGGNERYQSSVSAINACCEECNLIFHDSVRPLVSNRIINEVIAKLDECSAIDVAIPMVDTVIKREGDFIEEIPDRSLLFRGQTPQAFKLSVIKKAYELALQDPAFKTTDDCGVVRKYLPDTPIFIVEGEEQNMKLTYKENIYLLDKLFHIKSENVMPEYEEIAFVGKVVVVFGGSYGIGNSIVERLKELGSVVESFSRSENGVDICNAESVADSFKSVYEKHKKIDYVINTAAMLIKRPLVTTPLEDIDAIINTNIRGMINVTRESHKYLKETSGALLLYTSSSYTRGRAFYSLYSATKAAVVNFVQAVASEWNVDKIRVNCINPERTKTPMRVINFGVEDAETLLTAEQVAEASITALLSKDTGQVFDVKLTK